MTEHTSPWSPDELTDKLRAIRHVALDMDGTVYMGDSLFEWTRDFLATLDKAGISFSFLTNNPSKNISDYIFKLGGMGIEVTRDQIYTTALAAVDHIKKNFPGARRLFMLGTPSMIGEFESAGFISAAESADDVPDLLVVGFDTALSYDRLCRAAWWASQGIPYIATNPDRVCPTDSPTVLVDCGSICACIETATGRKPDITLGKPDPTMLSGIMDRYGLLPHEIAMAGDRIYTDMEMARNAGSFGILVLSGETTAQTALLSDPRPDLTLPSLKEFGELLTQAR